MASDLEIHLRRGFTPCLYEILYWLPDRPTLLAPPFVLQKMDLAPYFPELRRYLGFWTREIEGRLASVRVDAGRGYRPMEFTAAQLARLN